ncbi:DUF6236 family protein [Pseudomonas fragariae (ex Marin et al. 2024)]|uniref:DUF6236 family protein n=2 Tax=Pseudomonas fragariae (ex Marin et al. 2024) TaxID=3080056 RepID=A0ABT3LDM5_9PSED|nr:MULTISPECIES: DUF6236 family protein [unclassified Pseudomonas]MCW6054175.1 DUF6236 family protein [Pseudomonas fragi]MDV0424240.1 DUF6236 family protein [Pseudomonas sp. 17]MDX9570846.1 DUF6236 family protein [Pseudomonas sp. 21(2023)]MDX9584715.1 DUF6236 family protein [Pseudomonas sp. 19(2023)]MDX9623989.1 DUF6236 family protein [Pseudomonas sp. 20]
MEPVLGETRMKRGIVIAGADVRANGNSMVIEQVGIKPEDLRFYLTYFDLIERPVSNAIHIAPSPEEEYLASCNVLSNTKIMLASGNFDGGSFVDMHDEAFLQKKDRPGEYWVKGGAGVSFLDARPSSKVLDVVEMSLYELLPCPLDTVPLAEILEFKNKRSDELAALRAHLDEVYIDINRSGDIPRATSAALTRLSQSLVDLKKTVEPSFASRLVSGLRVHIDPIRLSGLAFAGGAVATSLALPVELGAGAGAILGAIKFDYAKTSKDKRLPDNIKDFSYLLDIQRPK